MNKTTIVVSIVIVLGATGLFLVKRNSLLKPEPASQTESEVAVELPQGLPGPTEVVETFLESFIASAPPSVDNEVIKTAMSLLSEGAAMGLPTDPTSGDLARLIGVQDLPDQGYEVGDVSFKDNAAADIKDGLAEVEVALKYSGGDTTKTFLLSQSGAGWKIDGIR